MKRDPPALISWDEIALALDEEPAILTAERLRTRTGDIWVGAAMMLTVGIAGGLCLIGAFTVARWMWGLA